MLSAVISDKALEGVSPAAPAGAVNHHSTAAAMPSDRLARIGSILMAISGSTQPQLLVEYPNANSAAVSKPSRKCFVHFAPARAPSTWHLQIDEQRDGLRDARRYA